MHAAPCRTMVDTITETTQDYAAVAVALGLVPVAVVDDNASGGAGERTWAPTANASGRRAGSRIRARARTGGLDLDLDLYVGLGEIEVRRVQA